MLRLCFFCLGASLFSEAAYAAEASVTAGLSRMVFGMIAVLLVIAALAWLARRVMPGQGMSHNQVIRQVGALALSPRERVVVLEVAGRWLVVGINGNQMTALGDLSAETAGLELPVAAAVNADAPIDPQAAFSVRLQQAMQQTLRQGLKPFKSQP